MLGLSLSAPAMAVRALMHGSPAFSLGSLFSGGQPGAWYDPADLATMFQDSAGATPAAIGSPVGRMVDKSGRGNHASQPTSTARPVLTQAGASVFGRFDGVDDGVDTAAFAAGTLGSNMDCFVAVRRSSAKALMMGSTPGGFFGCAENANSGSATTGSGAPTYVVNGIAVPGGTATTRGQLEAAMPVGQWIVMEAQNLDLSAWTGIGWMHWGVEAGYYSFNGDIGGVVLCPAQSDASRTQIRQALAAKVGITL